MTRHSERASGADARKLPPALLAAILAAALGACGRSAPDGAAGTAPAPRANLVLFSIDTLRAGQLGCYGYGRETSPAIDALAAQGIVFDTVHSQSPKTGPSHMTMMTGLYPSTHGVLNWSNEGTFALSEAIPTLAEILRENGYATFASTGGGNVRSQLGFDRGFSEYRMNAGSAALNVSVGEGQLARHIASGDARPFFLFLHTYQTHDPYFPPQGYLERIAPRSAYAGNIFSSAQELVKIAGPGWQEQHDLYWSRVDRGDPADRQRLVDLYDACVRSADDAFASLVAMLLERGLLERTVIVVTADHGEEFLEHGQFMHDQIYREIAQVPLVIRLPEKALAGRRVDGIARLVDVTPTLLDVLGVKTRAVFQGESLWSAGAGPAAGPRTAFTEWTKRAPGKPDMYAARTIDWSLVRVGEAPPELYAASDREEKANVASAHPDVVRQLEAFIGGKRSECAQLARLRPPGSSVELTPEIRQQLEQLGYLK